MPGRKSGIGAQGNAWLLLSFGLTSSLCVLDFDRKFSIPVFGF